MKKGSEWPRRKQGAQAKKVHGVLREPGCRGREMRRGQRSRQGPGEGLHSGSGLCAEGCGEHLAGRHPACQSPSSQVLTYATISSEHGILHLPDIPCKSAASRAIFHPAVECISSSLSSHASLVTSLPETCLFSLYKSVTSLGGAPRGSSGLRPEISSALPATADFPVGARKQQMLLKSDPMYAVGLLGGLGPVASFF